MRRCIRSLYIRISALFLFLLLNLALVVMIWSSRNSVITIMHADQIIEQNLAADIAKELERIVESHGLESDAVGNYLESILRTNLRVSVYLLDAQGNVLPGLGSASATFKATLNPTLIEKFLRRGNLQDAPMFGQDPSRPGVVVPFVVSPLRIADMPGYLYISLYSASFSTILESLEQRFRLMIALPTILIAVVSTFFIGAVVFFFFTKRFRQLILGVRQFAAGDYTHRIQNDSDDEIGELSNAFNTMAATIEESINKIEKNDTLRREFIANIAHDLRTPVASVRGYLELLLKDRPQLNEDQQVRFITTGLQRTAALEHLIGDLFELSKLEAADVSPQFESCAIQELVDDIIESLRPTAEVKGITLMSDYSQINKLVRADIALISRLLTNLICNAINHCPAGTNVQVVIREINKCMHIAVKDNGPGISESEIVHLFERFYRGKRTRSKKGGTGLGLGIAKKIANLHGSDISVKSSLGVGSEFSFLLTIAES